MDNNKTGVLYTVTEVTGIYWEQNLEKLFGS